MADKYLKQYKDTLQWEHDNFVKNTGGGVETGGKPKKPKRASYLGPAKKSKPSGNKKAK